jgi:hypothetical protein
MARVPLVRSAIEDGDVIAASRGTWVFRCGGHSAPPVRVNTAFKFGTSEGHNGGPCVSPPHSRVADSSRISRPGANRHSGSQFAVSPEDGEITILIGKDEGQLRTLQMPVSPVFVGGYRMLDPRIVPVEGTSLFDVKERRRVVTIRDADRISVRGTYEHKKYRQEWSDEGWAHVSKGNSRSFSPSLVASWLAS